jgi:hypothetical protein
LLLMLASPLYYYHHHHDHEQQQLVPCPAIASRGGQSYSSLSCPRCGSARYDVTVEGNMTQHVTWRSGDSNRRYGGCRKLIGVEGGSWCSSDGVGNQQQNVAILTK